MAYELPRGPARRRPNDKGQWGIRLGPNACGAAAQKPQSPKLATPCCTEGLASRNPGISPESAADRAPSHNEHGRLSWLLRYGVPVLGDRLRDLRGGPLLPGSPLGPSYRGPLRPRKFPYATRKGGPSFLLRRGDASCDSRFLQLGALRRIEACGPSTVGSRGPLGGTALGSNGLRAEFELHTTSSWTILGGAFVGIPGA